MTRTTIRLTDTQTGAVATLRKIRYPHTADFRPDPVYVVGMAQKPGGRLDHFQMRRDEVKAMLTEMRGRFTAVRVEG